MRKGNVEGHSFFGEKNRKWSIVTKCVIVKEYNHDMKNRHVSGNVQTEQYNGSKLNHFIRIVHINIDIVR